MIVTLVFSFYATPDISNKTREETPGDKGVVQAASM